MKIMRLNKPLICEQFSKLKVYNIWCLTMSLRQEPQHWGEIMLKTSVRCEHKIAVKLVWECILENLEHTFSQIVCLVIG